MYRVVMCAAAGALSLGSVAQADETLKWRQVQHATSEQTQQVGDVDGHHLAIYHIPGLAFFPDGSTDTSLAVGTQDFVLGSGGTVDGYYSITLADGSELWMKYTGTLKPVAGAVGKRVSFKGTAIVIGGKGRYAGAKGDGTWEGEATQAGPEGIAYADYVVNIKK